MKSWRYTLKEAKAVNKLAREKFKEYLLKEILTDLMICEIEGWCKMEYLNELRNLITEIGESKQ